MYGRRDIEVLHSGIAAKVDFDGVPGHDAQLNLQINGLYQNDLVFVPSAGHTAVPACMPLDLAPSAP